MPDKFSGKYHSLSKMTKEEQQDLIDQHYLFKVREKKKAKVNKNDFNGSFDAIQEGDRFLDAAKAIRFWPTGRGIFLNNDKTFLVWIGEEDHLRIISMQEVKECFLIARVLKKHWFSLAGWRCWRGVRPPEGGCGPDRGPVQVCKKRQARIPHILPDQPGHHHQVMHSASNNELKLLNIVFCRASVHIKLPKLAAGGHDALQDVATKYQLQVSKFESLINFFPFPQFS